MDNYERSRRTVSNACKFVRNIIMCGGGILFDHVSNTIYRAFR